MGVGPLALGVTLAVLALPSNVVLTGGGTLKRFAELDFELTPAVMVADDALLMRGAECLAEVLLGPILEAPASSLSSFEYFLLSRSAPKKVVLFFLTNTALGVGAGVDFGVATLLNLALVFAEILPLGDPCAKLTMELRFPGVTVGAFSRLTFDICTERLATELVATLPAIIDPVSSEFSTEAVSFRVVSVVASAALRFASAAALISSWARDILAISAASIDRSNSCFWACKAIESAARCSSSRFICRRMGSSMVSDRIPLYSFIK
mmetsp:Transcript_35832/g.61657  ORF Transcript_35832/g.61657 Transcript_35832/m.61657 type:complete len:266 (+) Transcript_35832:2233-3030(+)